MEFSVIENLKFGYRILVPLLAYWWIYVPWILGVMVWRTFTSMRRAEYLASLSWTLLEVRIPKDPHRSPKAMEQIFAGLHATYSPIKPRDAKLKGKVPDWFSFEVVSMEGRIRFFIRTPEQYRNMVQAQMYAQYSDIEIVEVEDYTGVLPAKIPNLTHDAWGAELALTKEDAYPIRTYEEFEEKGGGKDDIKRVDTMASLSELLSTLHTGEHLWIQYLVRPAGEDWVKRGQETIDKLMGKKPKTPPSPFAPVIDFVEGLFGAGTPPAAPKEEKKPEMAPGAGEAIRAIERSLGKLAHETTIRFVYVAPRESFHRAHIAGIVGVFKQFSTQNLNGFKLDSKTTPSGTWPFKQEQEHAKKVAIIKKYKSRAFAVKPFVLTTEELATVYHFPDVGVKSPLLPRVEAKKGEPPTNLPTMPSA